MEEDTKTCNRRCGETKPIEAFSKDGHRRKPRCKACISFLWRLHYQGRSEDKKLRRENQQFNQLMAKFLPTRVTT